MTWHTTTRPATVFLELRLHDDVDDEGMVSVTVWTRDGMSQAELVHHLQELLTNFSGDLAKRVR